MRTILKTALMFIWYIIGEYTTQMATNLERQLLVSMLYEKQIGRNEVRNSVHLTMSGLIRSDRTSIIAPYRALVHDWVSAHHDYEFVLYEEKILKLALYTRIQLVYYDINDKSKAIEKYARANSNWKHNEDGERYDFIVITNEGPFKEGLDGVSLGRLQLLVHATPNQNYKGLVRDDFETSLAIVRTLKRVETNNKSEILPTYEMTTKNEVIETSRIVRSAHMVPDWGSKITDLTDDVQDGLQNYSRMIWNTHSDAHAWNTYLDQENPQDES